jgi:hypothetical protein
MNDPMTHGGAEILRHPPLPSDATIRLERRLDMKLTPPKVITFWIAVILGVLGFLGAIVSIPLVSAYAFWFLFVGFILLVLGLLVKGL